VNLKPDFNSWVQLSLSSLHLHLHFSLIFVIIFYIMSHSSQPTYPHVKQMKIPSLIQPIKNILLFIQTHLPKLAHYSMPFSMRNALLHIYFLIFVILSIVFLTGSYPYLIHTLIHIITDEKIILHL